MLLWTLAVSEEGRRRATSPLVDDATLALAASRHDDVRVVLGHSGPAAARWREARALGPAEVEEPETGRRPRPLDEEGWDDVVRAFSSAASRCAAAKLPAVLVDASDGGLLAATLSPLSFPLASHEERRRPLARVVEAVRGAGLEVGVVITIEELAPGGLDASAGIEAVERCEGAGASFFVATSGSAWFRDLWTRERRMGADEPWLASALWLLPHTRAPVYAAGPVTDEGRALDLAREAGLAGICSWEVQGTP